MNINWPKWSFFYARLDERENSESQTEQTREFSDNQFELNWTQKVNSYVQKYYDKLFHFMQWSIRSDLVCEQMSYWNSMKFPRKHQSSDVTLDHQNG